MFQTKCSDNLKMIELAQIFGWLVTMQLNDLKAEPCRQVRHQGRGLVDKDPHSRDTGGQGDDDPCGLGLRNEPH